MDSARGNADLVWEVFHSFLRLGLTSFGGPVAHLGYFRSEFVERRRWLSDQAYADLLALCQFLPGPASSQVGMGLGLMRAGWLGMFAAWIAFTLPSAILLIGVAYGAALMCGHAALGVLHGLKLAAVAVVAQAVIQMARTLTPDVSRIAIAVVAAALTLAVSSTYSQIAVLVLGALVGLATLKPHMPATYEHFAVSVGRRTGGMLLASFFVLLFLLPVVAAHAGVAIQLFYIFYRTGAMVFGGGHVALPLLEAALVPRGFIDRDSFFAGYGVAQAVPGPLFTFSAYVGVAVEKGPGGIVGAAICLIGMFLPSFLLLPGVMPFWAQLSHNKRVRAALNGVNAAVVGLLAAALYTPVITSAVGSVGDVFLERDPIILERIRHF